MARNQFMNTFAVAACLGVVALVGWRAGAESTELHLKAEPSAVAIVDIERALNSLSELTDKNTALKKRVDAKQEDLNALAKQIEGLDGELKLLPENATEKRRELRARMFELTETANARKNAFQSLINIEKGEIIHPLYLKMIDSINEIATKEGYDLVLFDNRNLKVPADAITQSVVNEVIQQKSILYANNARDITDQVILLMNNKYNSNAN